MISARSAGPRGASLDLFPFLSVLVCAMGAMAFIVVVQSFLGLTRPRVLIRASAVAHGKTPTLVECRAAGLTLLLEAGRVAVERERIAADDGDFVRLAEALRAGERAGGYVVLVVYPDGIASFEAARAVLKARAIEIGFVPADAGWQVSLPAPEGGRESHLGQPADERR